MPSGNTNSSFGNVTKTFHWLTALLILIMVPLGLVASDMAHSVRETSASHEFLSRTAWVFSLHKTLGVVLFFIAIARILWAIIQPKPAPFSANTFLSLFTDITHWLLYGCLILTPLAGWLHHAATSGFAPIWWPFGQSLPFVAQTKAVASTFAGLHTTLVALLVLSITVHLAGVLKHQFWDRDATLERMLPRTRELPISITYRQTWAPPVIAILILTVTLWIGSTQVRHHGKALSALQALPHSTSEWHVTSKTLNLRVTLFGSDLTGTFPDWTANITFTDRATPGPAGQVAVTIAIASLTLGSVSEQALAPEYFNAERFPAATFSGEIEKTDTGYLASGPLTVRDKTQNIVLPFALVIKDGVATMSADLSLNRLDFGVGTNMTDESVLGFTTNLAITLTAQHQP